VTTGLIIEAACMFRTGSDALDTDHICCFSSDDVSAEQGPAAWNAAPLVGTTWDMGIARRGKVIDC